MRVYSRDLNNELLKTITNNLAARSTFVNETYLGQLNNDLIIKIQLDYGDFAYHPAIGVNVYIINNKHGLVDKHNFNFGLIWDNNFYSDNYRIFETGWNKKEPTTEQINTLAKEIESIISIYKYTS